MGKKKVPEIYDRTNLQCLARYMECVRMPLKEGHIPKIHVNIDGLETAIKSLPKKEREKLEKFWGLNPGTTNHSQSLAGLGNVAYENMFTDAKRVIRKLFTLEYLEKYEPNIAELIGNVAKKVDKGGLEISDVDAVKYLNVLTIMIDNGPQMPFDDADEIDSDLDGKATFDEYAMLYEIAGVFNENAPDHSINLKLLIETIEMFDLPDVVAIKKFANLPINREDSMLFEEEGKLETLQDIREFKERIFPYGCWDVTIALILGTKQNFEEFANCLDLLRQDWTNILKFKTCKTKTIITSEGKRKLDIYEIGGLEFTDPYEVMFLYVARNMIM